MIAYYIKNKKNEWKTKIQWNCQSSHESVTQNSMSKSQSKIQLVRSLKGNDGDSPNQLDFFFPKNTSNQTEVRGVMELVSIRFICNHYTALTALTGRSALIP